MTAASDILVIRLGAMGDIVHALPAVATLKHSHPRSRVCWAVDPKWVQLLEGNPFVDEVLPLPRRSFSDALRSWRLLRAHRFDLAIDFQGLMQSGLAASAARPDRIVGFHHTQLRERAAAFFYSLAVQAKSAHVVDRNIEVATAAGASNVTLRFPIPAGAAEGDLPDGDFVLASPLAGWAAKQWPMEHYAALAQALRRKGLHLVLNGTEAARPLLQIEGAWVHCSGLPGLIDATRRAAAVVGVDSGPLHLAAALGKPGVAVFGPTDPARNGPYGGTISVLRDPGAVTSYKRRDEIDPSMRAVRPGQVLAALEARMTVERITP
ncbi:MAG: glycosyltransferase family 9 protein [Bryobacteraceae bacterium]|nr:glycosyltransferase family 9 protein [Bryobacteraceae bacterium]